MDELEWIECPYCFGDEGHHVGDDWVDCIWCEGSGGYLQRDEEQEKQ